MIEEQTPSVDNTETELATLDIALSALAVPTQAAELIADALNYLAEDGEGDKAHVLDEIYDATSAMLQTAQKFDQGFRASLNIAKTIRQQREETRRALADLQRAVEECDIENPDIEALAETIREEQDEMMWYAFDDMLLDHLACDTPLDMTEAAHLLDVLREIDHEDHRVYELKEWIADLHAELFPAPPVLDLD